MRMERVKETERFVGNGYICNNIGMSSRASSSDGVSRKLTAMKGTHSDERGR